MPKFFLSMHALRQSLLGVGCHKDLWYLQSFFSYSSLPLSRRGDLGHADNFGFLATTQSLTACQESLPTTLNRSLVWATGSGIMWDLGKMELQCFRRTWDLEVTEAPCSLAVPGNTITPNDTIPGSVSSWTGNSFATHVRTIAIHSNRLAGHAENHGVYYGMNPHLLTSPAGMRFVFGFLWC